MDIRKLRHAVTLARLRSFTKAAQELNITQSALSRSIQALEKECRLQLFDRGGGAVVPTQSGREFIRHAEALLRDEAALRNVLVQASQGEGGHIALGVTPLVARALLPPVLSRRVGQAHFHAEVMIASSKQVLAMTARETVDLGICAGSALSGSHPFAAVPLARLPIGLVVRRDHPLTTMAGFGPEDLKRFPLVRSPPYDAMEDDLPVVMGLSRPTVAVEDYELLNRIVADSDAAWVTSPVAAREGIEGGRLVSLPLAWAGQASVTISAYSLRQRTLSPIARSILDHLQEVGAALAVP